MSAGEPGATLRVGVVGAGYFARFQIAAWTRVPGASLAAVCDLDGGRRAWVAERHPGVALHERVEAMVDGDDVDVLDIATPPASHLALVRLAAERALPAICQKPLAPTLGEAIELVETAEAAGTTLAVHENFRFTPWHREMKRFIDSGALGEPYGISTRLRPGDGQGPDAYLDRQPYFQSMTRFLVHETAIHWIDTYRFLLGEVRGVSAVLRRLNPAIAGEDAGLVVFDFASGASGLFDGNRLVDHVAENPRLTMGETWLEGSAGTLRLDGSARLWWKAHGEPEREHGYGGGADGFPVRAVEATQAHVVAHLAAGAPLENSGRDYLRNIEIEEAVYRAHAERRHIET